ncbi:FAD dependent oxidoreductase-domain-containing protein [Blastocladiella britannica]|nr:FAD dependent oxidoreductase-domain-containing protein [Blastocladiella britannica]
MLRSSSALLLGLGRSILAPFQKSTRMVTVIPPAPEAIVPSPNPTQSYWLRELSPFADTRTTPILPEAADVVIIGAGITGVSALYHLTQSAPHLRVALVDARGVAEGATGRNAGMATPLASVGFRARAESLGSVKAALDSVAFERKCVRELTATIDALGLRDRVQLRSGGVLNLAESPAEWEGMLADLEFYRKHTVRLADNDMEEIRVLDPAQLEKEFSTTPGGFYGGIFSSLGFQMWPFRLSVGLVQHCLSTNGANVNMQMRTVVTGISRTPTTENASSYTVHTDRGPIRTTHVVHATNAYVSHLVPSLQGSVVPVRGQMVAGKLAHDRARPTWTTGLAFNDGLEYLQQRDDGTLLLGGGREFATGAPAMEIGEWRDDAVNPLISAGLEHTFRDRFVHGPGLEVAQAWTGIMGFATTGQPIVGRLVGAEAGVVSNQWVAVGYTGHGMPRCFLAAKNLVLQILGREDEVDAAIHSCFKVPSDAIEPLST